MAREVIKRVGKRAYRYRVESYRDGAKVRARWTYLGVADAAAQSADPEALAAATHGVAMRATVSAEGTRERLVDAFERLVEQRAFSAVTAGEIATEAGLAHGTFYRYFKNKREMLVAALARVRDALERVRPNFQAPYGDLPHERRRVRDWLRVLATIPTARGVIRAWFDELDRDPDLAAAHGIKLRERTAAFAAYLRALAASGSIVGTNVEALASALTTLLDATFREAIVTGRLDASSLEGVSDVFDRAIFGALPRRVDGPN